eukprot:TRINITY_DN4047_c0_g1_i1.p1 TRINITY_DN4047_c0_g1~~TRINITY_DN4047_c0_g1_i1.p1  ORF type:complete len:122 (+),score=35.17 TRINITY_DN4047_c0_g1_i1:80-445(+)
MSAIYGANKDEFVTSLAAIALYDGDAEITADNINTLLAASNNVVAPYWPGMFASLLKDGGAEKLVFSVGGPAPAPVAVAAAGGDAPAGEAPKEEKAKVEEVDALDGGMDMFGGGGAKTGDY